jgi:chitodextrinase
MPPVPPLVIRNPWLANDRVADCRTLQTMAATFDRQYTPEGVIVPDPANIEQRAINNYNNFKRRCYHWAQMPSGNADVVNQMNVFGWALCGSHAGMNAAILLQMGLSPRTISIANGGHTFYEVNYNGKWHALDTMTTFYVYDRNTPRSLVNMADVKADKSLVLNAVAEGRACPGFLLCGDTPEYFANGSDTWQVKATPGDTATTKSMAMDLRIGEALTRSWESWATQYYNYPTNTPPYHHEAANDWKDTVNLPYWEPYKLDSAGNAAIGITYSTTYRRWANGTITLAPDFTSLAYTASLVSSSNIATFADDGLTPDLHVAAPGILATAVFRIVTPFYLTDANIAGTFRRSGASDINRVYVSSDGTTWTQVWNNGDLGTTEVSNINARTQVFGKYQMFVKVELLAATAITNAGVSNLVMTATFEHNKGGMAYLDKGVNNITLTFDNPQDLTPSTAIKVTYRWKENHGAGWTVNRVHEEEIATSPATFTINVGGTKVPRTESITVEVVPSVPDMTPPKPISDLRATSVDATRVDLAWTASGDDYDQGTATSYDLRYSTSPITADNFADATRVAGTPSPKLSGSAESFTVTGLSPSTTYWLAIKAVDNAGNASHFANAISITTLPPDVTPPATIVDLAAQPGTQSGSVRLTWTAPGDDGMTGRAEAYELRYQPQAAGPITAANWSSATVVAGVPAPQAAGASEQFTVTGLTWGARYYFAIVARDEVPNLSGVSNSPLGTVSSLGEVTLQDGLNGYAGCRDNYMYVGYPTTNYGGSSLMRVTGYGAAEVQRALVRFDVSSIPTGLPIRKATLWLYSFNPPQVKGSTGFYGAYKLTRDWGETTSSWNSPWTTPGGDFEATADAQAPKQSSAAAPCWYAFDVTARVQAWINNPSDNYGWLIKCTNEALNNQDEFVSSDSPDAAHRPKLVISDLPTQVPGDINGDGNVDAADILIMADSWGTRVGEPNFDLRCDLNGDNSVDVSDLLILAAHWSP